VEKAHQVFPQDPVSLRVAGLDLLKASLASAYTPGDLGAGVSQQGDDDL
jgi:hypothetical protein